MNPSFCRTLVLAAVCGISIAGAQTPATTSPAKSLKELDAAYHDRVMRLQKAMNGRKVTVAEDRPSMAADAIPAAQDVVAALDELMPALPQYRVKLLNQKASYESMLYVLNDEPTIARIDATAKETDSADGRLAMIVKLRARWIVAGTQDAAGRSAVIDEIEKLGTAHPDDDLLTMVAFTFFQQSTDVGPRSRLTALLQSTMSNSVASSYAAYFKAVDAQEQQQKTAAEALKSREGKPMAISGITVDGQAFSTEKWKGKVVLVDFWATWCCPCKRELPRVIALYGKYHDKGLEVLGVSNDYAAQPLKTYTAENQMPWPELFDAKSAAQQAWHPITVGFGIDGIPCMFLIDKQGICRSVTARESMEELIPKLLAE